MATLAHLKILIADDNPHMRTILLTILNAIGIKSVEQAEDGERALAIVSQLPIDIVLVDYNMKPMDGVEFTKTMRKLGNVNSFLPIIMLTGHSARTEVCNARDAGVTEFLTKPIVPAAVIRRLQQVIFMPRPFITVDTFFGPDRRRRKAREGAANKQRRSTDSPDRVLSI